VRWPLASEETRATSPGHRDVDGNRGNARRRYASTSENRQRLRDTRRNRATTGLLTVDRGASVTRIEKARRAQRGISSILWRLGASDVLRLCRTVDADNANEEEQSSGTRANARSFGQQHWGSSSYEAVVVVRSYFGRRLTLGST
jgi:hypothetical protein